MLAASLAHWSGLEMVAVVVPAAVVVVVVVAVGHHYSLGLDAGILEGLRQQGEESSL
jgi:hypothetical protein